MKHFSQLGFLFFIFWSCTNTETNPNNLSTTGEDYYPATVGKYVIYDVFQVQYNISQKPDTMYFQLKEVLADTFTNLENKIAYKLKRSIRFKRKEQNISVNSDSTWKFDSLWHVRIDKKEIVVNENNINFVKIKFPIAQDKTWNGNEYTILTSEYYKMNELSTPFRIASKLYSPTLKIIQSNDSSAIGKNFKIEIYAQNIGLIYKEKQVYEDACKYNFDGSPCIPGDKISKGIIYIQKAIRNGIE